MTNQTKTRRLGVLGVLAGITVLATSAGLVVSRQSDPADQPNRAGLPPAVILNMDPATAQTDMSPLVVWAGPPVKMKTVLRCDGRGNCTWVKIQDPFVLH